MGRSNNNTSKLLRCYRAQCDNQSAKPCWLRRHGSLPSGVNIHGYFLSEIGLGESARLVYAAMRSQDINLAACNRALDCRQNDTHFSEIVSEDAPYSISLTIAGLLDYRKLRHSVCSRKFNIAYPFWELEKIPKDYITYLQRFDQVWAPSTFIYDAFVANGLNRVALVKHPVRTPDIAPNGSPPDGKLKCLFFFDFDSFATRKNPEAVIHAFQQAFKHQHDVSLTVKTRGVNDSGRRYWLASQAANDNRITIVDKTMTRSQVAQMMADHDVFISLHRSEGLGLGCAEALAAGKIVVSTDYGGSTDFVNHDTAFPVAWIPIAVEEGQYPLSKDAIWADPSVDDAARQLSAIYSDPIAASARAMRGYSHLVDHHSLSATGLSIKEKLSLMGIL